MFRKKGSNSSVFLRVSIALVLGIFSVVFLTSSNFCYSQMRWINHDKIVDFVLSASNLTPSSAESSQICAVVSDKGDFDRSLSFLNALLGRGFYYVECVHSSERNEGEDGAAGAYFWERISVNSCGTSLVDRVGGEVTRNEYLFYLNRNYKLQQEQKK